MKGSKKINARCQTTLYCCIHPNAESGYYYAECRKAGSVSEFINDETLANELWRVSEELVAEYEK